MMKKTIACMLMALLLSLCALASAETASAPIPGLDSLSSFDLYSSNAKTEVVSEPGWTLVSPSNAGAKKAIIRGVETADFDVSFTTMLDSGGRVKVGLIFRASDVGSGQDAHSAYLCLLERKVRDGVNHPVTLVLHKYGKASDGTTDKHLGIMPASVTQPENDPLGGDFYEGAELVFTGKVEGDTFTAKVCLEDGTELCAMTADLTAAGEKEAELGVSRHFERGAIGFYLTNDGGNRPNNKIKDIKVVCEGAQIAAPVPTESASAEEAKSTEAVAVPAMAIYGAPVMGPLDQLGSYDLFASADGEIVQEGAYFTTGTAGNKKAILRNSWLDDFDASINVKIDPNANLKTAIVFRAQQAGDGADELEGYLCMVQRIVNKNRVDIIFYKYGMAGGKLAYLGELGRLVQEGKDSIVGQMVSGLAGQELTLHLHVEGKRASAYYTLADQPDVKSGTLNAWLDRKASKETEDLGIYYPAGAIGLYLGQVNADTPITQQVWDFRVDAPEVKNAPVSLEDGALYRILSADGCVMSANKFAMKENAWVVAQDDRGDLNQVWQAEAQPDGTWRLRNLSSGLYMTLRDGSDAENAILCVSSGRDGDAAQTWAISPAWENASRLHITSALTGKAVSMKNNDVGAGTQIVQAALTGASGQLWAFEKISSGDQQYPQMLILEGTAQGTSCPEIIREGDVYYAYNMGGGIGIQRSYDLRSWESLGDVFAEIPAWIEQEVPGGTIWAPGVYKMGDLYYCYYCASTSGSQDSAIGVAVSKTLDVDSPDYGWTDLGMVIRSHKGDDHNCIDPNLFIDDDGSAWLIFGSYWTGIKMRKIDPATGMLDESDPTLYCLANRTERPGGVEAPYIIKRDGYYYLFCAYGNFATKYYCGVGRSEKLTGPYVDRNGNPLMEGYHTPITDYKDGVIKVGHDSVFRDADGQDYLVCEYFWGGGAAMMCISTIEWTQDGWPVTALTPETIEYMSK